MAAARKKKRQQPAPAKKKADDAGFGTLGDRIGPLKRELAAGRKAVEQQRRRDEAEQAARPVEKPRRRLTEAELMAEAFAALGDDFAGVEKYEGSGFDASDVELVGDEPPPTPATPPDEDDITADDLMFRELLAADVTPIDRGKAALRDKQWTGATWRTDAELASLSADELERLETTPTQRDLLRRSRKHDVPVLKIRYYSRAEALREVEAFVSGCGVRGVRFARIIHGKGRQSVDGPVLKPAVIAWCEGAGSRWVKAWAPEIDQTGRFGSVVVELVATARR